tara:strand:+ start:2074 stop:2181 length:108 start_codon:yes stop_codon:yes gene_type:complete
MFQVFNGLNKGFLVFSRNSFKKKLTVLKTDTGEQI